MANTVLHPDPQRFPVGATVGAYPKSAWAQAQLPPSGAPLGSAVQSVLVQSDGTVTYSNLTARAYFLGALVSGTWQYQAFTVDPPEATVAPRVSQLVVYGHSGLQNDGTSEDRHMLVRRLAPRLGAKPMLYSKGASRLMWVTDVSRAEYGVMGNVLQTRRTPVRAAFALSANSNIGDKIISCTPAPNGASTTGPSLRIGDLVHVGDGTSGEISRVIGVSGTQITLDLFEGYENYGGLVRAHTSGDPVYVVPGYYGAPDALYLLKEAGAQHGNYGPGVYNAAAPGRNAQRWYQEALRAILARLRLAEGFEPDHTAVKFVGSWGAAIGTQEVSGNQSTAQGARAPTGVNASTELHLPDNFPGTPVDAFIVQAAGGAGGGVWTFTVDGNAWPINGGTGNTLTQIQTPNTPANKNGYYCARLLGIPPGRHKVVAQMTTLEASSYFDCWGVEAEDPPPVGVYLGYRFSSWDAGGNPEHGHIHTKLASAASVGDTSVSVNQSEASFARQLAAGSVPKVGETVVIDPTDASKLEARTVTSVTGAGPYTINFAGQPLAQAHAVNARVEMGMSDYVMQTVTNPWITQVVAEFDGKVIPLDIDAVLQKNAAFFYKDGAHLNDKGHAIEEQAVYDQIAASGVLDSQETSRLTRVASPAPAQRLVFLNGDAAVPWTTMPAALSEFNRTDANAGNWRQWADLSRFYEARIMVVQTVVGSAGSRLRIQYSLDGVTWKYLHRVRHASDPQLMSTAWVESTAAADNMCQIGVDSSVAGGGLKATAFEPIYPEALGTDIALRVVGIGGNGVANPAFMKIELELR